MSGWRTCPLFLFLGRVGEKLAIIVLWVFGRTPSWSHPGLFLRESFFFPLADFKILYLIIKGVGFFSVILRGIYWASWICRSGIFHQVFISDILFQIWSLPHPLSHLLLSLSSRILEHSRSALFFLDRSFIFSVFWSFLALF